MPPEQSKASSGTSQEQNESEMVENNLDIGKSSVLDDSLETLPIRAARRILQRINEQVDRNSELSAQKKRAIKSVITEERVLKELENLLGKEYINLSSDVVKLGNRLKINHQMDVEYSDRPEPVVLTNQVKSIYGGEDLKKKVTKKDSTMKRFDRSKFNHTVNLKQQQNLFKLFGGKQSKIDPRDYEDNEPIRLVYDEEKPSEKEIETYRGDKNEELTDEERALQQAVSYMSKFKDYFKYIQEIQVRIFEDLENLTL